MGDSERNPQEQPKQRDYAYLPFVLLLLVACFGTYRLGREPINWIPFGSKF